MSIFHREKKEEETGPGIIDSITGTVSSAMSTTKDFVMDKGEEIWKLERKLAIEALRRTWRNTVIFNFIVLAVIVWISSLFMPDIFYSIAVAIPLTFLFWRLGNHFIYEDGVTLILVGVSLTEDSQVSGIEIAPIFVPNTLWRLIDKRGIAHPVTLDQTSTAYLCERIEWDMEGYIERIHYSPLHNAVANIIAQFTSILKIREEAAILEKENDEWKLLFKHKVRKQVGEMMMREERSMDVYAYGESLFSETETGNIIKDAENRLKKVRARGDVLSGTGQPEGEQ